MKGILTGHLLLILVVWESSSSNRVYCPIGQSVKKSSEIVLDTLDEREFSKLFQYKELKKYNLKKNKKLEKD